MKKTEKIKKYRVSFCCYAPLNFECEVEARNEKEAFELGMMEANDDISNGLDEGSINYSEAELDEEIKDQDSPGVYIEEI